MTHASDFQVAPDDPGIDPPGYVPLCKECAESAPDLHHPPCTDESGATVEAKEDGLKNGRIFAARRVYYGHRDEWSGKKKAASFDLGFDLDCSDRPDGRPVSCAPQPLDGAAGVAWEPLPRGIDNAWLQRVLAPLYDVASASGIAVDLDAIASQNHEAGELGLLVEVGHWNGTPDDPRVKVNIVASPGVAADNGAPRWDGTDRWSVYPAVGALHDRYFRVKNANGYVSGGALVVDLRAKGNIDFKLGTAFGAFDMRMNGVFLAGQLSPEGLGRFTLTGRADLEAAYDAIPDMLSMLALCAPEEKALLEAELPRLVLGAADLPADGASPGEPCGAISFAFAFDAEPALVGGEANGAAPPDCAP